MVVFKGPYSLFTPTSPFAGLVQEAIWRGAGTVEKVGDRGIFTILNHTVLNLVTFLAITNTGVSITGYPIFIKVHKDNYGDPTPSYLPNSVTFDFNDNQIQKTWREWKDGTHNHEQIGDYFYIAGNSFGIELDSSVIYQLYADNYELLDTATYMAERLQDEPP